MSGGAPSAEEPRQTARTAIQRLCAFFRRKTEAQAASETQPEAALASAKSEPKASAKASLAQTGDRKSRQPRFAGPLQLLQAEGWVLLWALGPALSGKRAQAVVRRGSTGHETGTGESRRQAQQVGQVFADQRGC